MIRPILWMALAAMSGGGAPGGGASGGDAASADRGWSGDVPRAALAALPAGEGAEADHARFRFGLLDSSAAWDRYAEAFAGSPWPEEPWQPDVDWRRQAVVFVTFDGATHLLAIRGWRMPGAGVGELVVGAMLSRRREGPDGPCSMAMLPVGRGDVETVRVFYQGRGGEQLLGELSLGSGS